MPTRTRLPSPRPNDPERPDITERLAAAVYKQGDEQAQLPGIRRARPRIFCAWGAWRPDPR
jgi:hypothetical protein